INSGAQLRERPKRRPTKVAQLSCARCGYENSALARFCSNCGAELVRATAEAEERKLVSALFIDVVGSTARADEADPEDGRDFLRRDNKPVLEQIQRYGGMVEKFIGDAVLAIFGAPTSHGDDAERAVRCGLDIIEAIRDLNAADPTFQLSLRLAISTGEAVVTLGGAHERGEMLATGDVLNSAARLQAAAPANRLVVGARTHAATQRVIEYEAMPAVKAKGKGAIRLLSSTSRSWREYWNRMCRRPRGPRLQRCWRLCFLRTRLPTSSASFRSSSASASTSPLRCASLSFMQFGD